MKTTQEMMNEETKVVQCIRCDKEMEINKFASPLSALCGDCHKVVADRISIKSRAKHSGPTKICKCTKCNVDVEVTKFASADKVLCADCKVEKKRESRAKYDSDRKELKCIKCGTVEETTKFASPTTFKCSTCKGIDRQAKKLAKQAQKVADAKLAVKKSGGKVVVKTKKSSK